MKTISRFLLAITAVLFATMSGFFRLFQRPREACWNSEGLTPTHDKGRLTRVCEAAFPTRYLLARAGAGADGALINNANTRPIGVSPDEGDVGDPIAICSLGSSMGTMRVRASKAFPAGVRLFTAAGGKVTDVHTAGCFYVGQALTASTGDDAIVELDPIHPLLSATANSF